jgi:predicted metalloprotease with PDZ domain
MRQWCGAWLVMILGVACVLAQSGAALGGAIPTSGFKAMETLAVDATDAPRKVFHARMTIPATAGDFVLLYPKWIPGEHGPSGPVMDTAGIYFRTHLSGAAQGANPGAALAWHRDPQDMYAFHVEVPAGVTSIEASLDYLSPVEMPGGYTSGSSATDKLAVLSWNWVVFYPKGIGSDEMGVKASLKLPQGWKWASALPRPMATASRTANSNPSGFNSRGEIEFAPASLTTLVDSPVLMGEYMKKVALLKGQLPAHELDIAADSEAALAIKPEQVKAFSNLVAEAGALYGARHYREYHFLLTLSNHVAHFGLEHHESNDSRMGENYLTDDSQWTLSAMLLPHEYTHSWNGKYRRPAGMATGEYTSPMETDLLWVYEGLTQYLGYVLTARSGLQTPEQWHENLARIAEAYSHRPGRNWRPLEDTATSAQTLYGAPYAFSNYRRGVDYYDEGALIWLEADTILRRKSAGKKSMDDFTRLFFFGGGNGAPEVKPYTFEDVVNSLNQVQAYDWRGFFDDRVRKVAEHAPLEGIANSGWKLVYNEEPNAISRLREQEGGAWDGTASLGLVVNKDGAVADAIMDGIAAKNGVAPGMKIIAVNDRKFAPELLPSALRQAHASHTPIRLLVENNEYIHSITLEYFDGLRYPHLERDASKPDLLGTIIGPKVTTLPQPFTDDE